MLRLRLGGSDTAHVSRCHFSLAVVAMLLSLLCCCRFSFAVVVVLLPWLFHRGSRLLLRHTGTEMSHSHA